MIHKAKAHTALLFTKGGGGYFIGCLGPSGGMTIYSLLPFRQDLSTVSFLPFADRISGFDHPAERFRRVERAGRLEAGPRVGHPCMLLSGHLLRVKSHQF